MLSLLSSLSQPDFRSVLDFVAVQEGSQRQQQLFQWKQPCNKLASPDYTFDGILTTVAGAAARGTISILSLGMLELGDLQQPAKHWFWDI
jgi:hypothetical protein